MTKLKSWIEAFRLRTLPLALSVILMGSFLAIHSGTYNSDVIILALITTLFLQILSNLANDYGDGIKGTDNEDRVGPTRTIQSGAISPKEMKKGILVFTGLSLISGLLLIYAALGTEIGIGLLFLFIGLAAIGAAIKYTVGKNAYGYSGLGDVMVFIFFGPAAVMGTYYLAVQQFSWLTILPAISMGLFSTGVLNLNNMRDIENDSKSGKHTLAMLLGTARAKIYHIFIVGLAMFSLILFSVCIASSVVQFTYVIVFPIIIYDLFKVYRTKVNADLDPYLKKLAISTLVTTVIFGIALLSG